MDIAFSFEELDWARLRHCENSCGIARLKKKLFQRHKSSAAQPAHAADRLIEVPSVAGIVYESYWFLCGMLCQPAAADAGLYIPSPEHVGRCLECYG